jgi:hypothetical protein
MLLRHSVIVLVLAACGPTVPFVDDGTTGTSDHDAEGDDDDDDDGPVTTMTSTSAGTDPTTMTTVGDDTSTSTTNADAADEFNDSLDSMSILDTFGDSGYDLECDVWANDCMDGEKCMPWANDGGMEWNAARCSPLDPSPQNPGDPCIVEGNGYSGIDTCEAFAMCWGVDPLTNTGTCYGFCGNSEANPECPNGGTCFQGYDGLMILCVAPCDPLMPLCATHESCVFDATDDIARCIPTVHVAGLAYADPCDDEVFQCGTGLLCVNEAHVPSCTDSCCTTSCDLAGAEPCPDAASGQTCIPLYDDPPPGFANLGYCGTPA